MAAFSVHRLPGRGNGLVATRDLDPGEEVLVDSPLLLTVAPEARAAVCTACLRGLSARHTSFIRALWATSCWPWCTWSSVGQSYVSDRIHVLTLILKLRQVRAMSGALHAGEQPFARRSAPQRPACNQRDTRLGSAG